MRITYLFDPLCGWCYGASPVLERIAGDAGFALDLLPVGLFAGDGARPMEPGFAAYAWSNDQRIARLTGQPFSEAYRRQILADTTRPFDSGPATLALAAVPPERGLEALRAIQAARYVEGRDTTDTDVLAAVLAALGMEEAALRLRAPDEALIGACRGRMAEGRAAMRRFGITGVPALLAGSGDARRAVPANGLFGDADGLIASLRAG
jgi:putative protein-disulfide isomerase